MTLLQTLARASRPLYKILASLSLLSLLAITVPALAAATVTTTTILGSASEPVMVGVPVVLTATVTGTAPSGNVTFKDGTTTLGSGTLTGSGDTRTASYSATFTTVATHNLTAVYAGDTVNKTSTSAALAQTVGKADTSASVSASLNPSTFGTGVTFTATIEGYTPSGAVTFMDGTTSLGTANLSGSGNTRTASKAVSTLTLGSHDITVIYAGNTKNNTSTSSVLSQVVNTRPTTLTLTSSVNPTAFAGSTTLTATIAGGSSPSGTITFYDGATALGTSTVASSKATLAITTLAIGAHSITAVYSGNTNNATSTASALTQTVNPKTTTLVTTSSPNPSTLGANVTLTGTISSGSSPSGTITFYDDATELGTSTVASAKATLALTTLTAGVHNITSVYSGDTNNAPSTSAVRVHTIKTNAAITLASSGTPSVFDSDVTFTATVTGNAPTGVVSFKNGSAVVGTGTLTDGVATLSLSTLPVGTRAMTAVYGGDTLNNTKTSSTLSQVVSKATPVAALSSSANSSILGGATTLAATVSGSNPTGTVTFKDGSTTLGTGTLSGGTATLGISTLGVGSHNLTAVYAGDTNYLTSTSAELTQVVNSALVASTTTLSTSATPAAQGSAVSFSASVTGGSSPTGSVTFMDGSNTLGTGSLSNGVATLAVSSLTAGGHSITAVYAGDSLNGPSTSPALMQTITATPAMVYQYGYDAMGRPTIMVDPNGQTTNIYYDSLGRPIQTQQPSNNGATTPTVTSMSYNLSGALTSVTDPRNLATTYSPNGLGNVTAQTSPDSGASGYTYDANGNLLTKTDARGKLTSYTYDVLDRLKTVTYPSGTPTALEYDGGAAPYAGATGELTKITDESGSITYSYDSAGRLTSKTQITNSGGGGKTFVVGYTWGDSGSAIDKLIAITYPSGNRVNYSYDQYGQVSGISTNAANPLLSGITTNADGQPTGWSWANGKTQTIGYDSFGLIASYKLGDATGTGTSAGVLRTLNRDAAGRILGYSHTNSATAVSNLDQSFGYDNLNRLLSASQGSASTQYSYDATGNRTSKTVNATTYANTVSPSSNRLTQTQDVGGTASIVHDAAGNITSDGLNSFTYSDRGRMASATTSGGSINYRYNALELRVSKTGPTSLIPTGTSYYVYDEAGKLLGEYDANGAPLYETVYLGGSIAALPVGVIKQTGSAANGNIATDLYHVYADHTATPRVITRATDEAIVWRWDASEAFGGTTPDQNPNALGAFVFNQRFPGQVFDAETGLFDNWNRTYDARQGRYRQSDPIGLSGGINTFAYVGGNPLSRIDPTGLWSTVAHNRILAAFAAQMGLSPSQLSNMMAGSAAADAGQYQDAQHSYMHAMTSSDLSKAKSCGLAQNFVDKKVGQAVKDTGLFPTLEDPYWHLGFGLHAVMDSTSPAHKGFAYWTNWIAPIHGPFWTSWENDPSPAQIADTVKKMIDAMNGKFKFDCGCP